MQINSYSKDKEYKRHHLLKVLGRLDLDKLAKQTGFQKRKPRKLSPLTIVLSFFMMYFTPGQKSYRNWAIKTCFLIGQKVSKQALWKRNSSNMLEFIKAAFEKSFTEVLKSSHVRKITNKIDRFNNILLQDSTHIKLNSKLQKYYPGYENQHKNTAKSGIKLHTTYNIKKECLSHLAISSYRHNDQKSAHDIEKSAEPGDLVIRDLGYFVLSSLQELTESKVYYISRLSRQAKLICPESGSEINLAKILRKKNFIDQKVLLGKEKLIPSRVVALPLEESVASERRRIAKKKRDKRLNPNKDAFYIMGWAIFVTNLESEQFKPSDILSFYRLRWRIEILFKSWKSGYNLFQIEKINNKLQVESYIYLLLLFITISTSAYQYPIEITKTMSLLKYTEFINSNLMLIAPTKFYNPRLIYDILHYYCKYDLRTTRYNYSQFIDSLG